jgi:hypothetical protein
MNAVMSSSLQSFDLAFQPRGVYPGVFQTPPCLPPLTMTSGAVRQSGTYEIQTVEVEGGISETADMAVFE